MPATPTTTSPVSTLVTDGQHTIRTFSIAGSFASRPLVVIDNNDDLMDNSVLTILSLSDAIALRDMLDNNISELS